MKANPLNIYESYSYDIEFTMYPEAIGKNDGAGLSPGQGIMIAATGRTANFYVDRCQFTSIPSTKDTSINTIVTSITIDINEPLGFTMYERLMIAARAMGWRNPIEARYAVSVAFNGWKKDGSFDSKIHRTTWMCVLTDVRSDFDSSGTKYTVVLIPSGQVAFEEQNIRNQRTVTCEIKNTLEATLKEMSTAINKANGGQQDANNKSEQIPITYDFKLGSRLSSLNLKMYTDPQVGTDTSKLSNENKTTYTMQGGDTMEDILKRIVLNATNVADHLIPNLKADGTRDANTPPSVGDLEKWLLVQSEVSYSTFDATTGKYRKNITYVIDSHLRPDIATQPPGNGGSMARYQSYIANGLLNKRYDYLFTGKNTEVLEMKIDFNPMWSQLLGGYSKMPVSDPIATDQETKKSTESDKSTRLLPTALSGGGMNTGNMFSSVGSLVGYSRPMLEQLPVTASLGDLMNFTVAPITDVNTITNGVRDLNDKETAAKKTKLSEWEQQAKALNADPAFTGRINYMTQCDIVIRGDPYWLTVTNVKNNVQNAAGNDARAYANIPNGTQYFYVKFRTPESYDNSVGLPVRLGRITFSGVYMATTVTSTFEGGKFTQQITGILDYTSLAPEM